MTLDEFCLESTVPAERAIDYARTEDFIRGQGLLIARYVFCATRGPAGQPGIPISVLLAQMVNETAGGKYYYQGMRTAWSRNNPAGIGSNREFLNIAEGAKEYARVLNLSYYLPVRRAAWNGEHPDVVAYRLGESPWAESHYFADGRPGGALVRLMRSFNLYQFDFGATQSPRIAPLPIAIALAAFGLGVWAVLNRERLAKMVRTDEPEKPARQSADQQKQKSDQQKRGQSS